MWSLVQAVADAASDSGVAPPADSGNTQVLVFVGGIVSVIVTGLVSVIVALINSKKRDAETATAVSPIEYDRGVYERLAVLERRADDSDDRDEVQDRRLDDIERHTDESNHHWQEKL